MLGRAWSLYPFWLVDQYYNKEGCIYNEARLCEKWCTAQPYTWTDVDIRLARSHCLLVLFQASLMHMNTESEL